MKPHNVKDYENNWLFPRDISFGGQLCLMLLTDVYCVKVQGGSCTKMVDILW